MFIFPMCMSFESFVLQYNSFKNHLLSLLLFLLLYLFLSFAKHKTSLSGNETEWRKKILQRINTNESKSSYFPSKYFHHNKLSLPTREITFRMLFLCCVTFPVCICCSLIHNFNYSFSLISFFLSLSSSDSFFALCFIRLLCNEQN